MGQGVSIDIIHYRNDFFDANVFSLQMKNSFLFNWHNLPETEGYNINKKLIQECFIWDK